MSAARRLKFLCRLLLLLLLLLLHPIPIECLSWSKWEKEEGRSSTIFFFFFFLFILFRLFFFSYCFYPPRWLRPRDTDPFLTNRPLFVVVVVVVPPLHSTRRSVTWIVQSKDTISQLSLLSLSNERTNEKINEIRNQWITVKEKNVQRKNACNAQNHRWLWSDWNVWNGCPVTSAICDPLISFISTVFLLSSRRIGTNECSTQSSGPHYINGTSARVGASVNTRQSIVFRYQWWCK